MSVDGKRRLELLDLFETDERYVHPVVWDEEAQGARWQPPELPADYIRLYLESAGFGWTLATGEFGYVCNSTLLHVLVEAPQDREAPWYVQFYSMLAYVPRSLGFYKWVAEEGVLGACLQTQSAEPPLADVADVLMVSGQLGFRHLTPLHLGALMNAVAAAAPRLAGEAEQRFDGSIDQLHIGVLHRSDVAPNLELPRKWLIEDTGEFRELYEDEKEWIHLAMF